MPADVTVLNDGLTLDLGGQRVPLTPAEGFALAERLIRGATRAIVQDAADHALVRATLHEASEPHCNADHAQRG